MHLATGPIGGAAAWVGADMTTRSDWIVTLTAAELAEIDAAIAAHRRANRAMGEITPETFRLPMLAARLSGILGDLLEGRGFVLLRGFDVSERSVEDAAIAYLG